jgi:broad specificity phosphatase PhoE
MSDPGSDTGVRDQRPKSEGDRLQVGPSERGAGQRLFLVRHGQTSLNAAGALRGRLDPDLDATGLSEAMAVADSIGRLGLRLVVSSPLARAMETAAHIAAVAGLGVEADERLIDRDYGSWAGKPKAELIARWGSLDAAPDVEPAAEVFARAKDAFLDAAGRFRSGSAALVTHDAVLQLLLPALDPRLEQDEVIAQATGCFNVVEAQADGWRVTQVNVGPATPMTKSVRGAATDQ